MKKISFLIAAHNEEKIVNKTLDNLLKLPYDNYEIILGLDGCTDSTEEIIKKYMNESNKIKYYNFNLRKGKPAVINNLIKKSTGDIIIINDADWIFKVGGEGQIKYLVSLFDDVNLGGIAESFPVEWTLTEFEKKNIGYKMVAYSNYYWLEYQKNKLTYKEGKIKYLKNPTMFLTNIFRKKLYQPNLSLGDDFERTKHIMDKGYSIVIFEDEKSPRMIASYDSIRIKDLLKQKIRTSMARKQLRKDKTMNPGIIDYYVPCLWYMLRKSTKYNVKVGLLVFFWIVITFLGEAIGSFKNVETEKGWLLRVQR